MIADQAARDAALDPRRSFIVQAPAGSGKTELLVRRYLGLLKTVQQPEEILAITFTRKAAAEMRRRVLEKIDNPGEVAHRLRIQTIDSLCVALTRQMPVMSRFGAQPEIAEDAREFYLEAAAQVLGNFTPAVVRLLEHLDNNALTAAALLADILQCRDRWIDKTGAARTRADLEAALASERGKLLGKAKALHLRASEELAKEVLTKDGKWRQRPKPAPPELAEVPGLREALFALVSMPPAKYSSAQWEALEAILSLLIPAVAQLKVVFAERGQADFTEFSRGALQALGAVDDPNDLLLTLDKKISHILVDEFQDTSLSQKELLERLTAGWEPNDGRTLFVVGDPMQSIYNFREAKVGIFLAARHQGIGTVELEALTLSTNFRSQENLVAWFNGAFPRVLPAEEDILAGAVPYAPASPHDPALPGAAVTWHCVYDREAEAFSVVNILKEAKGKRAILVRNRSHLDHIVPALKEAGLRFRAVEIEQLGEKQVVQDLYALTRALSHPADRIAWLAVLRAPWCGLTLADLLVLSRDQLVFDSLADISALSPEGKLRAARLRDTLAPALAHRLRGPLRDRVEGAWLALGGPACVLDATELEDAGIFLDELERLEQAGEVDLQALAASLGELYALPDVNAGDDAVEIMTIHKAKGLEFDSVIVPGLDRAPRSGGKPLFAWKSLGASILLAPINEAGSDDDPIYNYVRNLEKEAEDIEAGRLLYVAATRAESRLHLLACAKAGEEGAIKPPARRSLLAKIWWQAEEHFGSAPAQPVDDAMRDQITDVLRRLPAGFALPAAPDSAKWKTPDEGREEADIEFSWAGETARHVGTVVHRWLQRIAEDDLKNWDAKRVQKLKPRFQQELQRRGVMQGELEASANLVATALGNALTDERGRWVLGPHPEARSEHRLRTPGRTLVIDRVIRDEKGGQWVVDFKTSRHEGADPEGFLDEQRKRYAAQLDAYAEALGGARRALYFPLLKGWREW